jgi:transmembrane sensor
MRLFSPKDNLPLDSAIVEQALHWMVSLQSGTADRAQQQACQRWRDAHPHHELAWQRLAGLNRDVRDSTATLPPSSARRLLYARHACSRRTLLKGFAGLGIATVSGLGMHERVVMPELFSDYRTATGERRTLQLAGLQLNLDTHTALDSRETAGIRVLALNLGRVLLAVGAGTAVRVQTADGWVRPAPLARLIISYDPGEQPGTRVQVLAGSVVAEPLHGGTVALGPFQQLVFDRHQASTPGSVTAAAEAWTQGLLVAERMPLGRLVAQLNRYRRGVLRCDSAVAGLQVSGTFSIDQPDASLDLLARVLPVRVQRVFGYWATVVPA